MPIEDKLYPLLRCYEALPLWVKSFLAKGYSRIPDDLKYGPNYPRYREELLRLRTANDEEVRAYQTEQIRRSLERAERTPFYRERFAASGVQAKDFQSLEDLARFPFLTKQDLIAHRESMLDPQRSASERLYITTGGSSGVPVGFYLERGVSRPKEKAHLNFIWSQVGWKPHHRAAILRGQHVSRNADGRVYRDDPLRQARILSSTHLSPARVPEYMEALESFKPDYIDAYPSSILLLTEWMREHQLKFSFPLKYMLCGSEKLSPADQEFLENYHGVPVMHWFGHSERAMLACQVSASKRMYFLPSYGYVELGDKCEEGFQEVIATSFHNSVMPLIRYRTGDLVKVPEQALAESQGIELEQVIGRSYEWLISRNLRRVSLTAFNRHDGVFDHLYAVQFSQREVGKLVMMYQPMTTFDSQKFEQMKEAVRKKIGDDFEIQYLEVQELERSKLGKSRWLVDSIVE